MKATVFPLKDKAYNQEQELIVKEFTTTGKVTLTHPRLPNFKFIFEDEGELVNITAESEGEVKETRKEDYSDLILGIGLYFSLIVGVDPVKVRIYQEESDI